MIRGQKPKPTAIRRREGNRGKRAWNHDEPQPPDGMPRCPRHLAPVARIEWRRVARSIGVSTPMACRVRATRRHSARPTGARWPGQRGSASGGCGSSWFQARLPLLPSSRRIAVGFGRGPM